MPLDTQPSDDPDVAQTLDAAHDYHYATFDFGSSRGITPEGFLLCHAVPIARTGTQIYGRGEIPVEAGLDHTIRIQRDEAEVFRPETIASANGKDVVDEHPEGGNPITPDNWREKSVGLVLNPRRGDGLHLDNSFLYADLLIKDPKAIQAINDGKRQVSAGYKAEYIQDRPGVGRQRNIVINHVALVDKGRCGPLCAIGDADMANRRVQSFRSRFRRAVRAGNVGDAEALVDELAKDPDMMGQVLSGDDLELPGESGEPGGGHHVTINVHGGKADMGKDAEEPMAAGNPAAAVADPAAAGSGGGDLEARVAQIEQVLAQIVEMLQDGGEEAQGDPATAGDPAVGTSEPDPTNEDRQTGDRRRTTGDSASRGLAMVGDSTQMRDGFLRLMSQAEILMPGIAMMTFDSAKPAKDTFSAMCAFRRKTLEASKGTEAGKEAITAVVGDAMPDFLNGSNMTCDNVAYVFNAAATVMAQKNNGRGHSTGLGANGARNGFSAKPPSPAEINERNAKFYTTH